LKPAKRKPLSIYQHQYGENGADRFNRRGTQFLSICVNRATRKQLCAPVLSSASARFRALARSLALIVNSPKNFLPNKRAQPKRAEQSARKEETMSRYQRKLYEHIASATQARLNCLADEKRTGKAHDWTARHESTIEELTKLLPSGSGIDSGVAFDFEKSTGEKLVFHFGFHHMDEMGGYDGWTDHTLTVKPSLHFGINLSISGRDRNQIKEYLHELFSCALTELVDYDEKTEKYFSISMREASEAYKKSVEEGKTI